MQGMCPPPPAFYLRGMLPERSILISGRDEASIETAHQNDETMAILDGSGRLAKAKSE
jgi:hypothetical protein